MCNKEYGSGKSHLTEILLIIIVSLFIMLTLYYGVICLIYKYLKKRKFRKQINDFNDDDDDEFEFDYCNNIDNDLNIFD